MRHPFRARLSALLFTAALLAGFCVSYAAPAAQSVHVPVWRGSVYVNSAVAAILDEEDNMQELFSYNGTIYIPLRQAGAWMGKQVDWDQQGKTVVLSGRTTARVLAAEEATGNQQTPSERAEKEEREKNGIDIQICHDITVTMDGVEQRFHNVKGERVYPAVYDQRVYLPVRSIGTLMGMEVTYYSAPDRGDGCVFLKTPWAEGERAVLEAYLEEVRPILAELEGGFLRAVEEPDKAQAKAALPLVEALAALEIPQSEFAQYRLEQCIRPLIEQVRAALERYLADGAVGDYDAAVSDGTQLSSYYVNLHNVMLQDMARYDWPVVPTA